MTDPEAGPVIPGSGGVRKLRWAAPGRGKRGGYRVIYYVRRAHGVIWIVNRRRTLIIRRRPILTGWLRGKPLVVLKLFP